MVGETGFSPTDEQIDEAALRAAMETVRSEAKQPPTCRRCSDCAGSEHHWIEEATYSPDDFARDFEPIGDHICKHCPAVGLTCESCDGDGECRDCDGEGESEDNHDDDGTCSACEGDGVCPDCKGWGVIVVPWVEAADEESTTGTVVEGQASS